MTATELTPHSNGSVCVIWDCHDCCTFTVAVIKTRHQNFSKQDIILSSLIDYLIHGHFSSYLCCKFEDLE